MSINGGTPLPGLAGAAAVGIERLRQADRELFGLLEQEYARQSEVLTMVAASSIADPSVLACEGSAIINVTTEGYPGDRFHAGCEVVDEIERMAIERARAVFSARYANVQPHSGSSANAIVLFSLLQPGDTILALDLDAGGHLTHGTRASVSGQYFHAVAYGLTRDGLLDYEQVEALAVEHQPKLIICGASAYPRAIDFARFRRIADRVGAYLLADVSHIAGLIVAGQHESSIDHAHITTTSTYKQLYGPRGGLILIGRDDETVGPDGQTPLPELMQRAVFPFFQGTPNLGAVAAKARCLAIVAAPEFGQVARRIVDNARTLAGCFVGNNHRVLTGGTDNHIVLIDVGSRGLTGVIAEKALEECNIIVNKNKIPGDTKPARVTSGIRLGTNGLAVRGMGSSEMTRCADLVIRVLESVESLDDRTFRLDPDTRRSVRMEVTELCRRFPVPAYPAATATDATGLRVGRMRA